MSDEERRAAVSLADVVALIEDVAREEEEAGLHPTAVEALRSLAGVPQEDRAQVVAVLIRLGVQFSHMHEKARATATAERDGWN